MVIAWCFKKFTSTQCRTNNCQFGGARRDRTADLLNAIQALSQLSYGPRFGQNQKDLAMREPCT